MEKEPMTVTRNENFVWILVMPLLFCGCTGTIEERPVADKNEIMKAYFSKVSRHDGVNIKEAVLLAQSELIFHNYEKEYHIDKPQLEFVSREFYGIRFFPFSRNSGDAKIRPSILVVVGRSDGSVRWHPEGASYLFYEEYKNSKRLMKNLW